MNKFKKGDRVIIMRVPTSNDLYHRIWANPYERYIGKTFTVITEFKDSNMGNIGIVRLNTHNSYSGLDFPVGILRRAE